MYGRSREYVSLESRNKALPKKMFDLISSFSIDFGWSMEITVSGKYDALVMCQYIIIGNLFLRSRAEVFVLITQAFYVPPWLRESICTSRKKARRLLSTSAWPVSEDTQKDLTVYS